MHESFKNFSTKFGESYSIINMYMYMAVRIACNEHAVNTIRLGWCYAPENRGQSFVDTLCPRKSRGPKFQD